jgi:NitT/TauT family transport system substrate-binding protein
MAEKPLEQQGHAPCVLCEGIAMRAPRFSRAQAVAGAAAAVVLGPRLVRAQALQKIRFAGVPTDDMTPIYYAIKNGMYEKAGLELEIVPTSSGTVATTAVVAGSYEMGKGSLIASLVAHLKSLPLVVVANGSVWDPKVPYNLALVAKDSPIKTGADLNGKIGAAAGLNDLNQLVIQAWVDKNGGDSKTMKWIEIPNSAAGEALAQHRIDVCALQEPQLSAELAKGQVRALAPVYSAVSDHFCFGVYFANAEWASKNGDAVKRWVKTTYDATAYTNAHHAETVAMMAEVTKIPPSVISKMARVANATSSDPRLLQPLIDTAAKYKNIDHAFPAKDLFASG